MFRSIARLEKLGIVLRVMAKQSNVESAYYRKKRYPCVKIIREPNDKDRQYLRSLPAKEDLALHHDSMLPVESNDDDAPGDIDIDMLNDEQEEENHAAEPATTETADEESRRNAPQWTPDHPLGNFLFNLIDSKGMKGMSSMVRIASSPQQSPIVNLRPGNTRSFRWSLLETPYGNCPWPTYRRLANVSTATFAPLSHSERHVVD